MDPELCALIKRHVVQVDAHNRYLEKKRMWREYEEEQARLNRGEGREEAKDSTRTTGGGAAGREEESARAQKDRRQSRRSHGILAEENLDHSDAFEGSSRSEAASESGKRVWRRPVVPPSFDVHAADRIVTAREKQRRLLRSATAAGDGDTWLPDKFYTHELQQPKPWVNPTEALSRYLTSTRKSSDDELTPKASTSEKSSDHTTEDANGLEDARRHSKKAKKKHSCSSKKRKKKRKKAKKV